MAASKLTNAYISACTQDSYDIPTATPIFSASSNLKALWPNSSWNINISGLVVAILDVRRSTASDSSSNSIIELLDLENIGVAVGISMLSGLQAELSVLVPHIHLQ